MSRTIIRQQTLFEHVAGQPTVDQVLTDVFKEPGMFMVEHKGYGEIVLTTKKGTRVVANVMYVTLTNDDLRDGDWEMIPAADLTICDTCDRLAIWRHPKGGLRCAVCKRPEK